MTREELARNVRFIVDSQSNVTSVVLAPEIWQRIVTVLEEVEHRETVDLFTERTAVGPLALSAISLYSLSE